MSPLRYPPNLQGPDFTALRYKGQNLRAPGTQIGSPHLSGRRPRQREVRVTGSGVLLYRWLDIHRLSTHQSMFYVLFYAPGTPGVENSPNLLHINLADFHSDAFNGPEKACLS